MMTTKDVFCADQKENDSKRFATPILAHVPGSSPFDTIRKFSLIDKVRLVYAIVRVGFNPKYTQGIFQSLDLFIKYESKLGGGLVAYIDEVLAHPRVKQLADECYLAPHPDLQFLSSLPKDSLGYAFATHMLSNNLKPDFYTPVDVTSRYRWSELRSRQLHDLFHVLTGFDISLPGELGLQAFMLGQLTSPLSAGIIGGGLLNAAFFKPWELTAIMEAVSRGYEMGRNAELLIGFRYEEMWDRSLFQIRELTQIKV